MLFNFNGLGQGVDFYRSAYLSTDILVVKKINNYWLSKNNCAKLFCDCCHFLCFVTYLLRKQRRNVDQFCTYLFPRKLPLKSKKYVPVASGK